jgi:hypothetical protein
MIDDGADKTVCIDQRTPTLLKTDTFSFLLMLSIYSRQLVTAYTSLGINILD